MNEIRKQGQAAAAAVGQRYEQARQRLAEPPPRKGTSNAQRVPLCWRCTKPFVATQDDSGEWVKLNPDGSPHLCGEGV